MSLTMPSPNQPVNRAALLQRLWRDQLWIWGVLGGAALLLYVAGIEAWLAHLVYQPNTQTFWGGIAWELRQWGAALPSYAAVAALGVLFWPKAHSMRPLLYQSAAALVLAAVLGAGLINQVVLQELTDRHRPRETLLIGQSPAQLAAELEGHSFPSGHAGVAFAMASPFFVLRRPRPKLAKGVLLGGLALGTVVGLGRMGLGAHYASDVLVAGAITLSAAALAAFAVASGRAIPRRGLVGVGIIAAVGMALGNAFKLTMVMPLATPLLPITLPCVVMAQPTAGTVTPTLVVHLRGYGVPVSNLRLTEHNGQIVLNRAGGVYHSLRCSAELQLPATEE